MRAAGAYCAAGSRRWIAGGRRSISAALQNRPDVVSPDIWMRKTYRHSR